LSLSAVAAVSLLVGTAPAQPANTLPVWAFVSKDANLAPADFPRPDALGSVTLRPNVVEPLYLYVVNESRDDRFPVTVSVSAGGVVIGVAKGDVAKAGWARLDLKAPDGVTPAAADPKSPAPLSPLPLASANTLALDLLTVHDLKGQTENRRTAQAVRVSTAASFLEGLEAKYIGDLATLAVTGKARNLTGPDCPVELVIDPAVFPDLSLGALKGNLVGKLSKAKPDLNLRVTGLPLPARSSDARRVSLTVDEVDRAFAWDAYLKTQAAGESEPFRRSNPAIVVLANRKYARTGDAVNVRVMGIELPDDAALTLKLIPGASASGPDAQAWTEPSVRSFRVGAVTGKDGRIGLKTEVRDRVYELATRGLFGDYVIKAQAEMTVGGDAKTIADEAVIVFDNSEPVNVRFLPPETAALAIRGREFVVRAEGADEESGISRVDFFVGAEPPAAVDGKYPPEPKPVPGVADPKSPGVYAARLSLPDKAGPLKVYARFLNNVGLAGVGEATVNVIDPPLGSLKVSATLFKQPQATALSAVLWTKDLKKDYKAKGPPVDGVFTFVDLPPGEYTVFVEQKTTAKTNRGAANVTVKEGPAPTVAAVELIQPR
jgi:hypothetical protein